MWPFSSMRSKRNSVASSSTSTGAQSIPQCLLDKHKEAPEPIRKEVKQIIFIERMSVVKLGLIKQNICSGLEKCEEVLKDACNWHPDDLADCIKTILNSDCGYVHAQVEAIPFINVLPDKYQPELHKLAAEIIKANLINHYDIETIVPINTLPQKYQPELHKLAAENIKAAFKNKKYEPLWWGLNLVIDTLPQEYRTDLHKLASKKMLDSTLDNSSKRASRNFYDHRPISNGGRF